MITIKGHLTERRARRSHSCLRSHTLVLLAISLSVPAFGLTTFGNPNDPAFLATSPFYSGVAALTIDGTRGCTGALLNSMTVLTAARCVTTGTVVPSGTTISADFGAFGTFSQTSAHIFPGYDPVTGVGDFAIVMLSGQVIGATTYDLYRNTNEVGQTADIVGFGRFGNGLTGYGGAPDGKRRHGSNFIDLIAASDGAPATGNTAIFLGFDFDDGTADRNAFAQYGSYLDLGTQTEVGAGPGDSGGPVFIGGKLAGIVTFATCFDQNQGSCMIPPDVDDRIDGSFGETFYALRTGPYESWIDQFSASDDAAIPEPSAFLLTACGLALLARKSKMAGTL